MTTATTFDDLEPDRRRSAIVAVILVHAPAGLATQISGFDILDEHGTRAEALAQRLVQVPQDAEPHVEPDQVPSSKGPIGKPSASFTALSISSGEATPFHEHVPGLVADRGAQPAGREPGSVGDDDRLLPELPTEPPRAFDGLVAGREPLDDLHQRHAIGRD